MSAGKILVVDDERELQEMLREFLESKGYEVAVAATGVEALGLLPAFRPDVVLLDVRMPEMDGVETLKRLVAAHPTLPVIMATVETEVDVAARCLKLGAADYVPKPFDLAYLEQAVWIQVSGARERSP